MSRDVHAVTGAFGYSGRYIARRLLAEGRRIRTLTNSPERPELFARPIETCPLAFESHERLVASLADADVLYNTYWVRFNHGTFNHRIAIRNTKKLFAAAREAGVRRIVHVSITNPDRGEHLEYFAGKRTLEDALESSGLSYAILRPAILFGREDVLINNIAWMLRTFPVFGVFGDGEYRLQPIDVDDFAALAVEHGRGTSNEVVEAIGPESFTYRNLVKMVGEAIGKPRPIVSISPAIGHLVARVCGLFVRDVIVTREEIDGLMSDLLHVDAPPAGTTRLSEWCARHADRLGARYTSELARRRPAPVAY